MAGSVNKVILVGRVGKDPEMRHTQDGSRIANLTLATSEQWKEKATGERKERTEWHRIVVFNDRLADIIERFVKKGSQIYLEGQLQTRKWVDNTGQEKYTTEVVLSRFRGEMTLLDSRNSGETASFAQGPDHGSDTTSAEPFTPSTSEDDFGDEIPF